MKSSQANSLKFPSSHIEMSQPQWATMNHDLHFWYTSGNCVTDWIWYCLMITHFLVQVYFSGCRYLFQIGWWLYPAELDKPFSLAVAESTRWTTKKNWDGDVILTESLMLLSIIKQSCTNGAALIWYHADESWGALQSLYNSSAVDETSKAQWKCGLIDTFLDDCRAGQVSRTHQRSNNVKNHKDTGRRYAVMTDWI